MARAVSAIQNGLTRVYTNDDGSTTVLTGGHRNWRNNNPGNLKYATTKNAMAAGALGVDSEGFAIFPDYQSGLRGMLNSIRRGYGNSTIDQAMERYAPRTENDTDRYIAFLKSRVGVPDSTLIKDFTPDELDRFVGGIHTYEGWHPGTITGPDTIGGPGSPAAAQRARDHVSPFQQGGAPIRDLAPTQAVEPAFGATSWPPRPASPNVLSPDAARPFAGTPGAAPIPFVDEAARAQQALDNSLPAPRVAPWDLADRFGKWSSLGGLSGPVSSGASSGLDTRSFPPVRFPLEALLAPDRSRGLNEWASSSPGKQTPLSLHKATTDPDSVASAPAGGLLGLIQDYMRKNAY